MEATPKPVAEPEPTPVPSLKAEAESEPELELPAEAEPEPAPSLKAEAEPEPAPEEESPILKGFEPEPEVAEEVSEPEPAPVEEAKAPEPAAPVEEDLQKDPAHKNAARIARVMVSDLELYYAKDVIEGLNSGDFEERLKGQIEEMRKTYETRVAEDVREKKDYLQEALDNYLSDKRKELGLDAVA